MLTERCLKTKDDQNQMINLARRFPEENFRVIDLPYRLSSWTLDDPENVHLWFDSDSALIAWCVLQTPFWTIDFSCHPGFEQDLLPKILNWADQRALTVINTRFSHPSWFVSSFSEQKTRSKIFEDHGFLNQADVGEDSWSKVLMCRSIESAIKKFLPPQGFAVRSLKGEEEVSAYVTLHQAVFGSKNMTEDWRSRTIKNRHYHQELDIVIETPDKTLAAFCICWYDAQSQTGQVEPLGCAKEFTNRALGRVALSEGLIRLQNLGAKKILVETDNYRNTAFRLYQSFGFEVIKDVYMFRKDYSF